MKKYTDLRRGQIVTIKYYDDVYAEETCKAMLIKRVDDTRASVARWHLYIIEDSAQLYPVGSMVKLFEFDLENRIIDIS